MWIIRGEGIAVDIPNWQLWILARFPRPIAIMAISIAQVALIVPGTLLALWQDESFREALTFMAFLLVIAIAIVGWSILFLFATNLNIVPGFCVSSLLVVAFIGVIVRYRKNIRQLPEREKKRDD